MGNDQGGKNILRLVLEVGETSAPYNQFTLPLKTKYNITMCSFFENNVAPPTEIDLVSGDGTVKGYLKVLYNVLKNREFDIIHVHAPHVGLFLLLHKLIRRIACKRIIMTIHNSYDSFKFKSKVMLLLLFPFYDRIICCSNSSYESFPKVYKLIGGKRIFTIQNGINIQRVDGVLNLVDTRKVKSEFTVISIGRLINIKSPFTLIQAYIESEIHGKLIMTGDGVLRNDIVSYVKQLSLDGEVEITGLVSRDKVYCLLSKADLFVSTSKGEGLPIAVLEAMACKCPVVLSDIPPHREIAEGVDFISLVKPDDTEGFAHEIKRFESMPTIERIKIGKKCRKLVEKKFNLKHMLNNYENEYNK